MRSHTSHPNGEGSCRVQTTGIGLKKLALPLRREPAARRAGRR
jgi:hypothetical protein